MDIVKKIAEIIPDGEEFIEGYMQRVEGEFRFRILTEKDGQRFVYRGDALDDYFSFEKRAIDNPSPAC